MLFGSWVDFLGVSSDDFCSFEGILGVLGGLGCVLGRLGSLRVVFGPERSWTHPPLGAQRDAKMRQKSDQRGNKIEVGKRRCFLKICVLEQIRLQEATWADLETIWAAKRLQDGPRGGS